MSTDSGDHLILHYTDPSVPGGVETAIGDFARIVSQSGGQALVLAGAGSWKPHPGIAVMHEPLLDADGASAREALSALAQGARGLPTIARLTDVVRERLRTLLPTGASWHLHNVATNTLNLPLTCALSELVAAGAAQRPVMAWTWDIRWMDVDRAERTWLSRIVATPWPNTHYLVATPERHGLLVGSGYPPHRVHVIRPAVSFARTLGLTARVESLICNLDALTADLIVLYPCRLSERKSIETALSVIEALQSGGINAKLIITGFPSPHRPDHSEQYEARLQEGLSHRLQSAVTFAYRALGGLSAEDVASLYHVADVVLITSHDEGFGLAGIEATLTDTPILMSPGAALATAPIAVSPSYREGATTQEIAVQVKDLGARRARRRNVGAYFQGLHMLEWLDSLKTIA